jgi:hypothetical protein
MFHPWDDGNKELAGMTELVVTLGIFGLIVFGIKSCNDSEWYQEGQRKQAAQDAADKQPRVIREVDGCKVYAFKSDQWHYFTRCPATTTTDRTYKDCHQSGKQTICETKTEQIVTENK